MIFPQDYLKIPHMDIKTTENSIEIEEMTITSGKIQDSHNIS